MRAVAEQGLAHYPKFSSLSGSAEATGLGAGSVDLITAAQAFHWFDVERTRQEFNRILRPGGRVALIWNTRVMTTPFAQDYESFLTRFGMDYLQVGHTHGHSDASMFAFFGHTEFARHALLHAQRMTWEGLRGRVLSSSYIPKQPGPAFETMISELQTLFTRYEQDGSVTLPYETQVWMGGLS